MKRSPIFVGLSGGVDSAVAAALLARTGERVIGVFLDVGSLASGCTNADDRRAAATVAAHLGIPFLTLPAEAAYRRLVLEVTRRELAAGRLPNPDAQCNVALKFGLLLKAVHAAGAKRLATGHYAQLTSSHRGAPSFLTRGLDPTKDQSYFLAAVRAAHWSSIVFPIGHLTKVRVRQLARRWRLPNAQRPDSQGLCFLGPIHFPSFVAQAVPLTPGPIRHIMGQSLGTHRGLPTYTIGQRHGHAAGSRQPMFVIAKQTETNTLVVSERRVDLERTSLSLHDLVEHPLSRLDQPLTIQVRYRQSSQPVVAATRHADQLHVRTSTPVIGPTPGQLAVLYSGDCVSASGIIA